VVAIYGDEISLIVAASDDLVVSVAADEELSADVPRASVNDIVAIVSFPVVISVCFFVVVVVLVLTSRSTFIVEAISVDPEFNFVRVIISSIRGPVRPGFDPVVTAATNEELEVGLTSVTTVYFVLAFSSVQMFFTTTIFLVSATNHVVSTLSKEPFIIVLVAHVKLTV
jgi:hypothetical protein